MSSGKWLSVSAPYVVPRESGAPDAWTEEAARHGARGTNRLSFAGVGPAPGFVATAFGISEGDPVITRQRIVYLNDKPIEIASSYYPTHIAAGTALEGNRKIRGGAITLLDELGYKATRVFEEVFAHMPDDQQQQELLLRPEEPAITIHRTSVDGSGQPFQTEIMTAPAKTRRLRYEMEVDR